MIEDYIALLKRELFHKSKEGDQASAERLHRLITKLEEQHGTILSARSNYNRPTDDKRD